MRRLMIIALIGIGIAGCASQPPPAKLGLSARANADAGPTVYTNGRWLTENGGAMRFVAGERYADNGVFVARRPDAAVVVDLGGLFIVPPYGEAHNHSVDSPATTAAAAKYIAQGTFYFKNPNSIYALAQSQLPYWRRANTLDVSFSFGGLSVDEGHPETLYRQLLGFGLYSSIDEENLDGNAFYDVSTTQQLDGKWDAVLANEPDFLKLYLLDHPADDSDGLSEDMFRHIVTRARKAGLPTTVHVETADDIALAVAAGANEAAHLPAYSLSYAKDEKLWRIADEVIADMARRQFVVVTTVNVSQGRQYEPEDLAIVMQRQADNLRRLHAAGVPIAIGSDTFFETAWNEIQTLRQLDVFSDAQLLALWVKTPGRSIFPGRAIGVLQPGYEESLLALQCNPLEDIDCAQKIQLGIKQGERLIDVAAAQKSEN